MKISQHGNNLFADFTTLPAQHSGNIEIEFEKDPSFDDLYIITPIVGYINNGKAVAHPRGLNNNIFTIPTNAFESNGYINIAFSLYKEDKAVNTNQLSFRVNKSTGGNILPKDDNLWQEAVTSIVEEYIDKYLRDDLNELIEKAKQHQTTATEQQNRVNELLRLAEEQTETLSTLEREVSQNEATRQSAESDRISKENTRNSNENTRKQNETTRDSNEQKRVSGENTRNSNENTRKTNETQRISDENSRKTNEAGRVSAENERKTATSTAINNCNSIHSTLTTKLNNGDFVPNISIGTVTQGSPNVVLRGNKYSPIFDITLPSAVGLENYYDKTEVNGLLDGKLGTSGGTLTGELQLNNGLRFNGGNVYLKNNSTQVYWINSSGTTYRLFNNLSNKFNLGNNSNQMYLYSNGVPKCKIDASTNEYDIITSNGGTLNNDLKFNSGGIKVSGRYNNTTYNELEAIKGFSDGVGVGDTRVPLSVQSVVEPRWVDNSGTINPLLTSKGGTLNSGSKLKGKIANSEYELIGAEQYTENNVTQNFITVGGGSANVGIKSSSVPCWMSSNNGLRRLALEDEIPQIITISFNFSTDYDNTVTLSKDLPSGFDIDNTVILSTHIHDVSIGQARQKIPSEEIDVYIASNNKLFFDWAKPTLSSSFKVTVVLMNLGIPPTP